MHLVAELLRRGYSPSEVKKIVGENILRVMREGERIAKELQKSEPPNEATIEELDGRAGEGEFAGRSFSLRREFSIPKRGFAAKARRTQS